MRSPAKPFALLLVVAAATFGLAQWHPLSPSAAGTPTTRASAARGEGVFKASCVGCHGDDAAGGVGPALVDNALTTDEVAGIVAAGRGAMPAGIVDGQEAADVAAYVVALSE